MKTSSTPHQIDLDSYFQRIAYTGVHSPTLETLSSLQLHHVQAIPFENLDPVLHRPVSLGLAAIEAKLVRGRRGGYCYEHNLLLSHVLNRLGFKVTNLAARVLWGQDENTLNPRSHMLLQVQLENQPYMVDVGFGGNTPTAPLKLDTETTQDTPHGPYRVKRIDKDYLLQTLIQNDWRPIYRFDLWPQLPMDYVAVNFYLSTSDDSHFRHSLYAALATSDGRRTLINDRLTIRQADGTATQTEISDAREAAKVLKSTFGIDVPDRKAFYEAWPELR